MSPVERPGAARPSIRPVPRDADAPLSFAQLRLWFLEQLEPGSNLYNIGRALRLSGLLDVRALEATLTEIVRRHESLRTTFTVVDRVPVQRIGSAKPVDAPVIDLTELPPAEREPLAESLATQEASRTFDLSAGPLIRFLLLKLEAREWIVVFTTHHIVSDGWSNLVLLREMAMLYEAICEDKPSPLPELPIQYADYASWQRGAFSGEPLEKHFAYWRRQLSGPTPVLNLPADRPRPLSWSSRSSTSYRGGRESVSLDAELSARLRAVGRRDAATPFMVLLSGFQTLLHCYSGQSDILIGTPVAGRNWLETEPLIGFFVNTLVLRTDLSGDPPFRELLKRVSRVVWEALAHQDLPFEKLVEELQPQRDLNRSPLFQVMFNMVNLAEESIEVRGLTIRDLSFLEDQPKFELILYVTEVGDRIDLNLVYDADLFQAATVSRMLDNLLTIFTRVAGEPNTRLSELKTAFDENERLHRAIKERELAEERREGLGAARRKPIILTSQEVSR
jgi:aspartate racemase